MTEPAHSPLGPSSADRWLNCPGSVRATENVAEVPSEYAALGTVAHTIAEKSDKQGVHPSTFLGEKHKQDGFEFTVDQEMVDAVEQFLEYVADLGQDSFCEERIYYTQYVKDGFGTMDRAVVTDEVAHIGDFKYGEGVQKWAKENPQLMLYALGWWLKYGWLHDNVVTFVLHIVQPRLGHVDQWEVGLADLLKWAEDVVRPGALLTESPDAPFKAGEWCQFCKIRRTCKARAESVFMAAVGDFDDLDEAMTSAPKAAATLTNDQVAKALSAVPAITQWIKDIKDHAASEVLHGRPVGDYKFVAGRESRVFAEPEAVVIEKIKEQKPDIDTAVLYTVPEFKSMPQVEKEVGKSLFAPPTKTKEAGPLFGLVKKVPGKPTLVPGHDKRPSLDQTALEDFDDLDANENFLNS